MHGRGQKSARRKSMAISNRGHEPTSARVELKLRVYKGLRRGAPTQALCVLPLHCRRRDQGFAKSDYPEDFYMQVSTECSAGKNLKDARTQQGRGVLGDCAEDVDASAVLFRVHGQRPVEDRVQHADVENDGHVADLGRRPIRVDAVSVYDGRENVC